MSKCAVTMKNNLPLNIFINLNSGMSLRRAIKHRIDILSDAGSAAREFKPGEDANDEEGSCKYPMERSISPDVFFQKIHQVFEQYVWIVSMRNPAARSSKDYHS